MSGVKRLFNIFILWSITSLMHIFSYEIPLRYRLFKKRLFWYLFTSFMIITVIKHCDYIYYDFAFNEIHKYARHMESEIWQTDAKWYFPYVERGHGTLVMIFIGYQIYFILSSFWISLYGLVGKYKDDISILMISYLLCTNDWFVYGYIFYICQIKLLLLALFLYNFCYWTFMLVLWDEEMEAYYENQVDLATKGRENFKVQGDHITTGFVEDYTDETRPDMVENKIEEETFEEWKEKQGLFSIIDTENLHLKGQYVEDSVVEAVWDLETRYKQYVVKFYGEKEEDQKKKKVISALVYDEEMDFEMVKYNVFFTVRYWEEVEYWKITYKYDIIRIYILAIWHMIRSRQFNYPKVVGPYSIFSPYFRADVKKLDEWHRLVYLTFFKNLILKILRFFSIKHRYQNWRWLIFKRRFCVQLNKLKKRNSINYNFFKKYR